jgi:hypothetical protein
MKKIRFIDDFDFAEDGINPTRFAAGSELEVSASCADSAVQELKAVYSDDAAADKAKGEALKALAGPPVYVPGAPTETPASKPAKAKQDNPKKAKK